MRNPTVDEYVDATDQWPDEIEAVRSILLDVGLTEDFKWAKPCYTHQGANVVILQEMKAFLALMFFKGSLLDDPGDILREQGPNSRSARRIEITSVAEVDRLRSSIEALTRKAMAVEDAGMDVDPAPEPDLVEELRARLATDPALTNAFEALTPGRRREYHLYISGAKRTETRESRIDKVTPRILDGKGLRDR